MKGRMVKGQSAMALSERRSRFGVAKRLVRYTMLQDKKQKGRPAKRLRASRKWLKAGTEEVIEGKKHEQRPSSHGAPQRRKKPGRDKPPSSSSLSRSKNLHEFSPTHATTTKKAEKPEGIVKRAKGSRIVAKKLHKSRLEEKKVKKILEKMAFEVAEKRGETSYMKELHMEEAAAMEAAAKEMQSELARNRAKNQIQFVKNICIQRFVDVMLGVFEAEDNLN